MRCRNGLAAQIRKTVDVAVGKRKNDATKLADRSWNKCCDGGESMVAAKQYIVLRLGQDEIEFFAGGCPGQFVKMEWCDLELVIRNARSQIFRKAQPLLASCIDITKRQNADFYCRRAALDGCSPKAYDSQKTKAQCCESCPSICDRDSQSSDSCWLKPLILVIIYFNTQ